MNDDELFQKWWDDGKMHGQNLDNAPRIAKIAFKAAMAISRNYVADDAEMPEKVTFANGRVVKLADSNAVFLEIE